MCIIIVKEKHQKMPSMDFLTESWMRNYHGFGYMYHDGSKLVGRKGLVDDIMDIMDEVDKLPSDAKIAFHFRFATTPEKTDMLCHPFDAGKWGWLMHNGIYSLKYPDGSSDSEEMARRIKSEHKFRKVVALLETWQGCSRTLLLRRNGEFYYHGDWVTIYDSVSREVYKTSCRQSIYPWKILDGDNIDY